MNHKKKVLAIIPARGGSKRIPKKNLVSLGQHSLVQISMKAAIDSQIFDQIVLSSDEDEILKEADIFSEEITTLKRSESLSSDTASSIDVVLDVMSKCGESFDYVCLLQPTSPFRRSSHIVDSFKKLISTDSNSLVSVKTVVTNPFHIVSKSGSEIKPLLTQDMFNFRTQMTPDLFCLNGCIYFAKFNYFAENKTFLGSQSEVYLMNEIDSLDIDTPEDLQLAKDIMSKMK